MAQDVEKYRRLVRKVTGRTRLKNTPKADLEQTLWLKLLEVMPRYEAADNDELFSIAHTVLINHAINLIKHEKHESIVTLVGSSFDSESIEDCLANQLNGLHESFCTTTDPEKQYMLKEVSQLIFNWAKRQKDKRVGTLIKNLFDPEAASGTTNTARVGTGLTMRQAYEAINGVKTMLTSEGYYCPSQKRLILT